jgi:hypothetical protein
VPRRRSPRIGANVRRCRSARPLRWPSRYGQAVQHRAALAVSRTPIPANVIE